MNMHDPYMHNSFWNEQQVAITFQLEPVEATTQDAAKQDPPLLISKPTFIDILNLDKLGSYLADQGYVLDSFKPENTAMPISSDRDDAGQRTSGGIEVMQGMQDTQSSPNDIVSALVDETGKYLFFPKDARGYYLPTLVSFFTFTERGTMSGMAMSSQSAMDGMTMRSQAQGKDGQGDGNGKGMSAMESPVARLVNLINRDSESLRSSLNASAVTSVTASPIWQCGGTTVTPDRPISQGCPLTPPMPVTEVCSTSPGLWPITLPELPSDLQDVTGDGVTVFVLDTLPKLGTIKRAAEGAEKDNLLLVDVMENVVPLANYQILPDALDVPSPHMPETGKDLYGRVVGFHMADHGLFEAGVIHDIAPDANIECIRVLNDFCVGDVSVLIQALDGIYTRVMPNGDLHGKPVVINMSLVIPADSEAINAGIDPNLLDPTRQALYNAIKALADFGVVFAASAGNEGDLRYTPMNPDGERPDALYPAAYAYYSATPVETMIPVGAINSTGKAASYSCYPGPRGVAAYGGEVPAQSDIKTVDHVTHVTKIDGMIGIYSALQYPALSVEDRIASYPVPNARGWAYWVGTSFATPIISALAARVLEATARETLTPHVVVQQAIVAQGATRQVNWDRLAPSAHGNVDMLIGNAVWAEQKCKPTIADHPESEGKEEVEINLTEVHIDEVNVL
jgi:hypothetical protein